MRLKYYFDQFLLILFVTQAFSNESVHVKGHVSKGGTYVQPHYRSSPDGNFSNNWSTKGNINPYTGKEGSQITPPLRGSACFTQLEIPSYTPQSTPVGLTLGAGLSEFATGFAQGQQQRREDNRQDFMGTIAIANMVSQIRARKRIETLNALSVPIQDGQHHAESN